ncbi:lanthionine synthetase C family protein [Streptomyces sp. NRRL B-24572]|uniref:lanthionine synthetase C family protein n=1 Tax=Streptomyces sp. NRRL B-24572 TaxID=1962156 RepID=UPI000A390B3D|nr:lanthionine synthetase C family protein [Streptomyces sp. NRRL B-24572]
MITDEAVEVARRTVDTIAERLASPDRAQDLHLVQGWMPQSLAYGAVGVALLHIERARTGQASWEQAHAWLACAAASPAAGGPDSHLFHGAPALAFALRLAAERTGRYSRALSVLDQHITGSVRLRLDAAHDRIDRGRLPALAEFDGIRGLSGMATLLMTRDGEQHPLIHQVLTYLVRLTEPVKDGDDVLPGWWTDRAPSGKLDPDWPGGHANFGMAHGVAGPLAALSRAALHGLLVDGQLEAIRRICDWLDRWRQDEPTGPRWPYYVRRSELRTGVCTLPGPLRPSWCYGTAGLARAQQLAGLALEDIGRQRVAEDALLRALSDPAQLDRTVDASLCHGFAGLALTAQAAASDALTPQALTAAVPALVGRVLDSDPVHSMLPATSESDIGFLEGAAGVALALHGVLAGPSGAPGWASSLLIN